MPARISQPEILIIYKKKIFKKLKKCKKKAFKIKSINL
jgi:hypothetical protein